MLGKLTKAFATMVVPFSDLDILPRIFATATLKIVS
jgi:hypothetical protein